MGSIFSNDIFIFDFDLTLTSIHVYNSFFSSNFNMDNFLENNPEIMDASYLRKVITDLKNKNCKVYIASFGLKEIIEDVLKFYDLFIFDGIITPENFELNTKKSYLSYYKNRKLEELQFYSNRNIVSKLEMIKYIQKKENNNNCYFFDDDPKNINHINNSQLKNVKAVLVKNPIDAKNKIMI